MLTYRHGHFGPALLGPLRTLFPSPMQSNWRLYLEQAPAGAPQVSTVFFLKNIMNSLVYALGTRLFSDVLPTHLAASFTHRSEGGVVESGIVPGAGSAPALACAARVGHDKSLAPVFAEAFGNWQNAVQFIACQDAAIAHVERLGRLALGEIQLPVDLAHVLPLQLEPGAAQCSLLAQLPVSEGPFGFMVPAVKFHVLSERLL
ncbi:hypothetical protein [Janthinobacterium agaricidamnosum]|uniref:Uncharacterized protein n=1 Tax=Janthinobacterium agaricidamnosum NBRC 102515 = DSM 9628 TaxID=1349767 RepID=W0V6Z4_9BURK|nr:hypothetical protein [Janthinobacterium agaricidamnosum]CDG83375.1 putative uncharacterized protein [Janthinobacterium agaricidamnosum NBRC 102515 = DSM 9628]